MSLRRARRIGTPRRRAGRGRLRGEAGSSTVEMVILFPLIVILLLGGTQVAVWFYGRQVAQSAAQSGARAASSLGAASDSGRSAAEKFLAETGGGLSEVAIGEDATADQVTVTVRGKVPAVIPLPGFSPVVTASSTRPVEHFTAPDGAP